MTETPGRNDPCWCGSGKKYKKCHADADREAGRDSALPAARDIFDIYQSILPPPQIRSDQVGRPGHSRR